MNDQLKNLYPSTLWDIFANICAIPHPSKHEFMLLSWLKSWASEHQIECAQDETGNLVMRKPATAGMENRKTVILQAHVDMVPQANSDSNHDFTRDPICPVPHEDGWVRAKGTTLGADNGIGVAAALSMLCARDVEHGPLEVLLTIDEETGMTGAFGLAPNFLKGDILINLDSETEGELYVGCAGGLDANISLHLEQQKTAQDEQGVKLFISGLKGGHSGMDIHLGRASANKLLTRFLHKAKTEHGLHVAEVHGGDLRNAIAREVVAVGAIPASNTADLKQFVADCKATWQNEFALTEPALDFRVEMIPCPEKVLTDRAQDLMIGIAYALPHGVQRMSDSMPGLVETSNNFAIFNLKEGQMHISTLIRSSVNSEKEAVGEKIKAICALAGYGAEVSLTGCYPGWKPNMQSPVLKSARQTYREKFGIEPKVMAVHAGLECGLFGVNYPAWDMISFGPTILHPHSPDERVNIESVGKFWDFLVALMKNIPCK
jgi:dipeptidase D